MTIMVMTKRAEGQESDMAYRKGELNKRESIPNTGWPYQMALPADACTGAQYDVVHNFCRNLRRPTPFLETMIAQAAGVN